MANEFPQLSDVFALDKQVTYKEAVEQVWLPQDNAILSVPSASPIETLTLSGYTITPTVALGAITYESGTTAELHFIDYSNLRDGAIIQIRILDNTYPITIKNGITGNGGIFTNNGEDILLSDYRKIVQLQREGSIWRQVGTIQSANLPITNCITEIPQNIKLELVDGTLTLKAGSKVYIPNGFEGDGTTPKFDVVVTESDLTSVLQAEGVLIMNVSVNALGVANAHYSGASQPTLTGSGEGAIWYNTAENKMYRYDGSNWESNTLRSLPVGKVTATSLDQVFNGFGYIGSTVFALPGVKGLIPNGRNEDGTLKNTEFTTDSVWVGQTAYNTNKATLGIVSDMKALVYVTDNDVVYDEHYNKNKRVSDGVYWQGCFAGAVSVSDMKFTSLQPKLPFRAADEQDVILKQDKATAVNYDNITNCITEIPQDIKLELNNGTMTLKAGSKVYVPNGKNADGSNRFDEVVVASDLTTTDTGNRTLWFTYDMTANKLTAGVSSETGAPVSGTYKMYYDSSENKCFVSYASSYKQTSFPICIIKSSTTGITSINQVFNGFGYIGGTVFALPGVKGLIPNGRNADGTLKNIEFTVDSVVMGTATTAASLHNMLLTSDNIYFDDAIYIPNWQFVYKEEENIIINTGNNLTLKGVLFGKCITDSNGVITSFTPRQAFHAVDYNDVALKQNFQVVSTLPSSPQPDVFYFIPE